MDTTTGSRPKLSKTCDQCKARKVRCVSEYRYATPLPSEPGSLGIQRHHIPTRQFASTARLAPLSGPITLEQATHSTEEARPSLPFRCQETPREANSPSGRTTT
ncbi:hypothetical protein BJX68DRAFT_247080 [Aspergillus pseudodeflectus]|uniref:Zn(2)-C6 fungal-type domain-containing protein n=1 Tax=Aspergillus pseudodeflectus TaxID=176178 RepID=A0ABR4JJX8_9EURO